MLATGSPPGNQGAEYFDINKFETLLDRLEASKRKQQKEASSPQQTPLAY